MDIDMTFGPTTTKLITSHQWANLEDTDRADGLEYGRFQGDRHELADLWAWLTDYGYGNGGIAYLRGHARRAAQRCLDRMNDRSHRDWVKG